MAPAALIALAGVLLWGIPSLCPVRMVLGIPCPSCGLTRAARAAFRLDFAEATHMHPLWFVVLPSLTAYLTIEVGAYVVRGRSFKLAQKKPVRIYFGIVITALIALWIARFAGAFGGPVPV